MWTILFISDCLKNTECIDSSPEMNQLDNQIGRYPIRIAALFLS